MPAGHRPVFPFLLRSPLQIGFVVPLLAVIAPIYPKFETNCVTKNVQLVVVFPFSLSVWRGDASIFVSPMRSRTTASLNYVRDLSARAASDNHKLEFARISLFRRPLT